VAGLAVSTGTARTAVGISRLRLGCYSARASACQDRGENISSSRRPYGASELVEQVSTTGTALVAFTALPRSVSNATQQSVTDLLQLFDLAQPRMVHTRSAEGEKQFELLPRWEFNTVTCHQSSNGLQEITRSSRL
jgi:hypothetical protein